MKDTLELLAEHPFVADLSEEHLLLLGRGAVAMQFDRDEYIFREHEEATRLYLVCEGSVALNIHAPQARPIPIQTISAGQALGWSWLVPPYKWHFDARAILPVTAVLLDGPYLRGVLAENSEIACRLLWRITCVLAERLQATRLQLMDVYKNGK